MQKQNQFMEEEKSLLSKVLNYKLNPENAEEQAIRTLLKRSYVKVEEQIIHGDIYVFNPNQILSEISQIQSERRKKEEELQKIDLITNQENYKNLKRQIIKLRKQQGQLSKKASKIKSKSIIEKVKKWEEIQEEIKNKKLSQLELKQKQAENEAARELKLQADAEKAKKQQKRKQINNKLKKIEEQRLKRQQIIKFAEEQYSKLNPKYIEIQKKFKQIQEQIKFEKDIYKKNHKIGLKIDHQAIKSHEQNYMTQVKERNQKRRPLQIVSDSDFTPFVYRSEQKIAKERQKLKRRREFQDKLKQIHIDVSEEKKLKIQIARDKGKNPLKYHFLSQKALADQKIYEEFQNFEINSDPKEIGKQYLKELPTILQGSRIAKSQSLSYLNTHESSQKSKYKDYLQELKEQRRQQFNEVDEQKLTLMSHQPAVKSKILQKLDEKTRKYEIELKRKKQQLQKYNAFQTSVKKSKELDQIYVKSLKAKLACIQMTQ